MSKTKQTVCICVYYVPVYFIFYGMKDFFNSIMLYNFEKFHTHAFI